MQWLFTTSLDVNLAVAWVTFVAISSCTANASNNFQSSSKQFFGAERYFGDWVWRLGNGWPSLKVTTSAWFIERAARLEFLVSRTANHKRSSSGWDSRSVLRRRHRVHVLRRGGGPRGRRHLARRLLLHFLLLLRTGPLGFGGGAQAAVLLHVVGQSLPRGLWRRDRSGYDARRAPRGQNWKVALF